ncbi:hypothetical protein GBA52_026296, partial [Prunus armeniaca]
KSSGFPDKTETWNCCSGKSESKSTSSLIQLVIFEPENHSLLFQLKEKEALMLRPCACARRISHRAFSTINLPTPSGLNLQTNNLLGEVRDLSTRGQVKEALSLFYTLQPPPHCNQTYAYSLPCLCSPPLHP